MSFSGLIDLPWWGYLSVALIFTHITIASVTIFLHRHQAHRALELHGLPSHFFRFWLWLTTGMITREWAAIHRKHHAKCETQDDPHSPQILGLEKVLWEGVELYRQETKNRETIEKYGHGTPDDWIERKLYSAYNSWGLGLMLVIDLILFGTIGLTIWAVQMLWIPLFAAGVINGIGHFWGYRNYACEDASTNIVPWGILIGGEELHNNHHAYASSAKLSSKWYEFDIGWLYIQAMQAIGLAKVKKVAPKVRLDRGKTVCDLDTLQAIITHRYEVLTKFTRFMKAICAEEITRLKQRTSLDIKALETIKQSLHLDARALPEHDKTRLEEALDMSQALATIYQMRQELIALWGRSASSSEQLLQQLDDWCHRAEASGIEALREFSMRLYGDEK
jgi:stearoyl-CoA desaturase (delta-9 desaturase)